MKFLTLSFLVATALAAPQGRPHGPVQVCGPQGIQMCIKNADGSPSTHIGVCALTSINDYGSCPDGTHCVQDPPNPNYIPVPRCVQNSKSQ
ncbi:hypothetical protein CkaCkLH20_12279 [Colletotrichum karsti]|uniref:Uncharacterized protein n=1 Tax=Colletotrichum karsti TaxID=1095194 RepID=A0A9P6LEB1_9PEZI|nr:uncharacterized protein CkaCkLH20_12279 [Colletotrichum karsti]KAF9870193.1 hypothetical protein CkaCkLH20_12279 [Colletotrichum karsti]